MRGMRGRERMRGMRGRERRGRFLVIMRIINVINVIIIMMRRGSDGSQMSAASDSIIIRSRRRRHRRRRRVFLRKRLKTKRFPRSRIFKTATNDFFGFGLGGSRSLLGFF